MWPEILALWPSLGAENLDFFASAYGLRGARKRERIAWALGAIRARAAHARSRAAYCPAAIKQRLAMAAALLHEPEILFLDEPTSGADPLARREFWQRITPLAQQGVTSSSPPISWKRPNIATGSRILDRGRMLAHGTPASVRQQASRRRRIERRWRTPSSPSSSRRASTDRR